MKANTPFRTALAATLAFHLIAPVAKAMDYNTAHGIHMPPAHGTPGTLKAAACTPAVAITELAYNNVRALITTSGLLWYDKANNKPAYEVPKTVDRTGAKAIFSGGLWMGGLSPDNQLKIAAIQYRNGNDFWPGPLTTGGDASVTSEVCSLYDRFYTTERLDAERHRAYYECLSNPQECNVATEFPDGYITPTVFFDWPAINNTPGFDTYLAPFTDVDGNSDYDPNSGDYPGYDLERVIDCNTRNPNDPVPLFGDHNIWWVMNDKGNQHTETGGQPIGLEIRSQAFAFATNDEINNMTFYNYLVINRGTQTLTNAYFGQYADPDLGFADDDFTGCDVQRGLGYVYNGDENDEGGNGNPGYGMQPPAIGIDFFEGPYQDPDGVDNPGPPDTSEPFPDCGQAVAQHGIGYKGIGIGYGDNVADNERFGMRAFLYFNREGPACCNDPGLAVHYYNYLRSIWKDGTPMTHGGATGYEPNNPNAVRTYYMFPSDSDPIGWGTDCTPQGPWQETVLVNPDRRFVQSAGPFTLEPGDYNNITVGVVYARASSGGAWASVLALRKADDKAQALFDNCFRILDGPDAPDLDIEELDRELILYLTNPNGSNNNVNYPEDYAELDPTIPEDASDRYYHFQGYQVYQVRDGDVGVADVGNEDLVRLLGVYDLDDGVDRLINWIYDQDMGVPVATEMVNAPDTGVVHSIKVTEDLFATGDKRLVNYKTYYYMALAYGYNNFQPYNPDPNQQSGQAYPFKAGRKSASGAIRSWSGIPHPPASELGGTIQNAQYGDQFAITRLEGQGNGGLAVAITRETEDAIVASPDNRMQEVKYLAGFGPVKVKVVDPLRVPDAHFELYLKDTTSLPQLGSSFNNQYTRMNDAWWTLVRINPDGSTQTVDADRSIEVANEQLIVDWGISVTIDQPEYTGQFSAYTKPLGAGVEYADAGAAGAGWYMGVPDVDGETAWNWIRSGLAGDTALDFPDYTGYDDDQTYEKTFGTWSPFRLVGDASFQPGASSVAAARADSYMSLAPSIQVTFTSDKSKWTRCAVLEAGDDNSLPGVDVDKLRIKPDPSRDKNGRKSGDDGYNDAEGTLNGAQPTGMSWFPGYAIDLETGERLNVAFAENTFWGLNGIGADMIWNPITTPDNFASPEILMAQNHWTYFFTNRRRSFNDVSQMPLYDQGAYLYTRLSSGTGADRTRVWRSCAWVGSAVANMLLTPEQGLVPADLRIRLDISKAYLPYIPYEGAPDTPISTDRNGGLGLYTFSTDGLRTETEVNSVEREHLDRINVVPNPYYAFSGYETSRLDNRVKFINLPRTCTISIYSVSGTLVRQFKKDNDLTFVDWDLKNHKNVPVSGGTYICHVNVPGSGEKVLKWFGVMRPVDLQNF